MLCALSRDHDRLMGETLKTRRFVAKPSLSQHADICDQRSVRTRSLPLGKGKPNIRGAELQLSRWNLVLSWSLGLF